MSKKPQVAEFPGSHTKKACSHERIWGKAVIRHSYAGIPSILIRSQRRLGISPIQMNILIQLLDYWRDPTRPPFPSKKAIADRIGVTP